MKPSWATLLTVLLVSAAAPAQWLDFADDTATRLTLEPLSDAPLDDPLFDAQEKDMAVADLDRDGDDDLIVVRKLPFSFAGARQDVLLMNEAGVLVDRTATLAPEWLTKLTDARDVFIADFTGDGWDDVVIANTFEQQPSFYRNRGNDGGGNWLGLIDESTLRLPFLAVPADISTVQICAVWAGDVTGDGALDLYFSNYAKTGGTTDVLLINDGNGTFTNETAARLGDYANVAFGTSIEIQDIDSDGDNDIIKISTLYDVSPFDQGQYILFNDGNGVFDTTPFQLVPSSEEPYMFAIGDLNGDGILDQLLQGDDDDHVLLATGKNPDGTIEYDSTVINSARTMSFGGNTKLADLDGDGDLDGAIAPIDVDVENCGFSPTIALLENQAGVMTDPYATDEPFHLDPHDFAFLDLNSDGCLDLVQGLCTGWAVFIQQNCQAQAAPRLQLGGSCPGPVTVTVDQLTPSGSLAFVSGPSEGTTIVPAGSCTGETLGIESANLLTIVTADASGEFTVTPTIPQSSCGARLQALDLETCAVSNVEQIP